MDNLHFDLIFIPGGGVAFYTRRALASAQTATRRPRTLNLVGMKIACLFMQAQPLLFSQNHFSDARFRHRVKVFYEVLGAVRGGVMKRRTARQLVRLLSDIRHAAHCSTLRAAATNRTMALAAAERDADAANDAASDESAETARDVREDKPARSGS